MTVVHRMNEGRFGDEACFDDEGGFKEPCHDHFRVITQDLGFFCFRCFRRLP